MQGDQLNGPLGIVPWGFGNFLGLKGDEGVLRYVSNYMQPTFDMLDAFAGPNAREVVANSYGYGAATVLGSYPALVCPSGEVWLVRGIGIGATTIAGEMIHGKPVVVGNAGQGLMTFADDIQSSPTDAVGAANPVTYMNRGPFFMFGGDYVNVIMQSIVTAATINVNISGTIYRFRG